MRNGALQYCASLPIELLNCSGGEVYRVSHHHTYTSLVESATAGSKFCELLLDAIRRNFLGNISPLMRKLQAEAFSLRSDFAGQYFHMGSWVMGVADGRKLPDGFRKFYLHDLALI